MDAPSPNQTLHGHTEDRVWSASWSSNGRYLATCGEDKSIRVFTAINNEWEVPEKVMCIATLEDGQSRTIRSCQWSPCSRFLSSASFDGTVVIWEAQNSSFSKWDMIASLEGHENEVKCVGWSSNGRWLATCGRDKSVWIWELVGEADFECVTVLQGHTQDVKSLLWHPNGTTLFSASYDDTIKVWKEDGDDFYCAQTLKAHASTVWDLALSPDCSKLVSCSADTSLICWQSTGMAENEWMKVSQLGGVHRFPVYSVDWSKHNGHLVTGGGDDSICLISQEQQDDGATTLRKEFQLMHAHAGDVNCVRWNPSDKMSHVLVSTGDDGLARLWQLVGV